MSEMMKNSSDEEKAAWNEDFAKKFEENEG